MHFFFGGWSLIERKYFIHEIAHNKVNGMLAAFPAMCVDLKTFFGSFLHKWRSISTCYILQDEDLSLKKSWGINSRAKTTILIVVFIIVIFVKVFLSVSLLRRKCFVWVSFYFLSNTLQEAKGVKLWIHLVCLWITDLSTLQFNI